MDNLYYYYLAQARYFDGVCGDIFRGEDVPEKYMTVEFIKLYVEFNEGLGNIPKHLINKELCELHLKNGGLLKCIPKEFMSTSDITKYMEINDKYIFQLNKKQICKNNKAINIIINKYPQLFTMIPANKITDDLILGATIKCNELIKFVPQKLKNKKLFENFRWLEYIPQKYMTEDIVYECIKSNYNNLQYIDDDEWLVNNIDLVIDCVKRGYDINKLSGKIIDMRREEIIEAAILHRCPLAIHRIKSKYDKKYKKTKEYFYINRLIRDQIILKDIPSEFINYNILYAAIFYEPSCLKFIDEMDIDPNISINSICDDIGIAIDIDEIPRKYINKLAYAIHLDMNPDDFDKIPEEIITDAQFLKELSGGLFYIPDKLLNEEVYIKLVDIIDSSYQLLDGHDNLLTDRIIERALTKFPSMISQLSEEIMEKDGKKWYDFAVLAELKKKIEGNGFDMKKIIDYKSSDIIFY